MASRSSRFRPAKLRPGPSFAQALGLMRDGAILRFEYDQTRPSWSLGDQPISLETVNLLISCGDVQPDSDTLFPGAPAQCWRIRLRESS